jgi:hypothetical protein
VSGASDAVFASYAPLETDVTSATPLLRSVAAREESATDLTGLALAPGGVRTYLTPQ